MTDLLLRLFVKHASDTSDPAVRAGYGRLAGVTGIVCNLLLFALKLLAGTISGSVSITADAVNNLSDASGSIVTLVGFKLASRPADDEHPYGHARMEYLSGLAVAVLILVIGVELVKSSVGKILHPEAVEFSALIVVILVCSILVKLWMAVFNRKLGRRIGSAALTALKVEEIPAEGQPFDPNLHNAVMQKPAEDGQKSGTVVQVFQKGYKIGDRIIRHATVVVAE